jgi:hypothetical protein
MSNTIVTKICRSCNIEKPILQFQAACGMRDNFSSRCKSCDAIYQKEYNNRPKAIERRIEWREQNKDNLCARAKKRYKKVIKEHPERIKASKAVQREVRRGNIPWARDLKCVLCEDQALHYHHESYKEEDWLKVIALCPTCHNKVHHVKYI